MSGKVQIKFRVSFSTGRFITIIHCCVWVNSISLSFFECVYVNVRAISGTGSSGFIVSPFLSLPDFITGLSNEPIIRHHLAIRCPASPSELIFHANVWPPVTSHPLVQMASAEERASKCMAVPRQSTRIALLPRWSGRSF